MSWAQSDEFSPPQPGFDRGVDQEPVLIGDGVDEPPVLVGGEGAAAFDDDLGKLGFLAWVEGDDPVPDGSFEHGVQQHVVFADAGRRQPVAGGGGDPVLDVGRHYLADLHGAEERKELSVQIRLVGRQRGGFDVPRRQPDGFDVGREGDLPEGGVVPLAVVDFELFADGGALSGAAGGEAAGGALGAVGVAVAAHVFDAVGAVAFDHPCQAGTGT